ncbi:MAG: 50S ribosomal protein L17 [Melioribacteraceae bacterium]|nr:50S ribosomal protein L17 [Melioribacteraceae bacterium]
MRHRVKGRKLSRTASHRLATLRSLSTALLKHKKIKTTVAKAKETRTFVEPLITKAKDDSVAARRHVARHIKDKEVVKELFTEIVEKIGERAGGYTRVVKLGSRPGDGADMAILELVDFNSVTDKKVKTEAEPKAEKTTKAKKSEQPKAKVKEEDVVEAEVIEETKEETKAEESVSEETTEDKKEEKK